MHRPLPPVVKGAMIALLLAPTLLPAQTHIWQHKAGGQAQTDCEGDPFSWPVNQYWNQSEVVSYCSGGVPYTQEPSNWNTPNFPNSPTAEVLIDSAPTVDQNISVSVGTLEITAGNACRNIGATLTVHGGTITNNGLLDLDDQSSGVATLQVVANTLLTGSGETRFVSLDDNYITSDAPTSILTIDTGHLLTTVAGTIAGESRLSAATVNNGTIVADFGGLLLDTYPKTNNSLIKAGNGGYLQIHGTTIENHTGTLEAGTGSTIQLSGATIRGGDLTGDGLFDIAGGDATFSDEVTVAADSVIELDSYERLTLQGPHTLNGRIKLDDTGSSNAEILIDGPLSLDGNGSIEFISNDDNLILANNSTDVLTIGEDLELVAKPDSLVGQSRIAAAILNNGLVKVDEGGLQLDTYNKVNRGQILAENGGTLKISAILLDNANGRLTAAENSFISLSAAEISGGQLDGAGDFTLTTSDATLSGNTTLAADTTLSIDGYDRLTLVGPHTIDGTILIDDQSGSLAELAINGPVTLSGSGQIRMVSNDDNYLIPTNDTDLLTIGPDLEVVAAAGTIAGESRILTALSNQGTLSIEGGLRLDTHDKTNTSLIEVLGTGILQVNDITLDNAGGLIDLAADSKMRLQNAIVENGNIAGSGLVIVSSGSGRLADCTIGESVTARVGTNRTLLLEGSITNNGTLEIADTSGGYAYLRIDGNVLLNGTGAIRFVTNDDSYLVSVNPTDVLTIGPAQTVSTSDVALKNESRLRAAMVNQGVVEARVGSLTLDDQAKTNQGIFRAVNGGTLHVAAADTILTNYDGATNSLNGGTWEIIGETAPATIDLVGTTINHIGPATEVVLVGDANLPQLNLLSVEGSLALAAGKVLTTPEDEPVSINGLLEFGLPDGSADGFDATRLNVQGNLDLTGCTIRVTDSGLVDGTYQLLNWTGSLTGSPTLETSSLNGYDLSLSLQAGQLSLVVVASSLPAPEVTNVGWNPGTSTISIYYLSEPGVSFGVKGGTDMNMGDSLPDTAIGNGTVMEYQHQLPAGPGKYFFQLYRK